MRGRVVVAALSVVAAGGAAAVACGKSRSGGTQPQQGFALQITDARVDGGKVVVTYQLTENGQPRTIDRVQNRWTLAELAKDPASGLEAYQALVQAPATGTSFLQPTFEANGTNEDLGNGTFRYTYKTTLPQGDDLTLTHRVGVFSRLLTAPATDGGAAQYAPQQPNVVFDFVPAGGTPRSRQLVAASSCNACHGEVTAHGGFRRGVQICTTCHTTQLKDPHTRDPALAGDPNAAPAPGEENPLDFSRLIHRVHRGANLPTLTAGATPAAGDVGRKYAIVGFGGSQNVFGQVTTRTDHGVTSIVREGVGFPRDLRDCAACHAGAPAGNEYVSQVARRTCQGCHADVAFDPSQVDAYHRLHPAGAQPDDTACRGCHGAGPGTADYEFGADVVGAHTVPYLSKQLRGLNLEVKSVAVDSATRIPTVVFRVTNGDGSVVAMPATKPAQGQTVPPGDLNSMSIAIGGPTAPDTGAANLLSEDPRFAGTSGRTPDANGDYRYTFTKPIPSNAVGTWIVGIEGRRSVPVQRAAGGTLAVTESGFNPVRYFNPSTGSFDGAAARRTVVEQQRCEACHLQLRLHGDLRRNVAYCVVCHAADGTDWTRRPKAGDGNVDLSKTVDDIEERSIHFKAMVHKIHTGENLQLTHPFVVYGFGGSVNFFDDVRFPGNLANCNLCHAGESYRPESIPQGASPTLANETGDLMHHASAAHVAGEPAIPPIQAACLACHDTQAAHDHARQNTNAVSGEQCLACHGRSESEDVRKVHGL